MILYGFNQRRQSDQRSMNGGHIEALIITIARITAFYHYQVLMLPLSPLSPFTDGNGSNPSEGILHLWVESQRFLIHQPFAFFPLDFFPHGMWGTEAGEELVTHLRTACKSALDLPNPPLKWEACDIPSFIQSKGWIWLKQWRLHTPDPEPMFKKEKKKRLICLSITYW